MAERFKAAVLKTVDREVRGFESLSLRQPSPSDQNRWASVDKPAFGLGRRLSAEVCGSNTSNEGGQLQTKTHR